MRFLLIVICFVSCKPIPNQLFTCVSKSYNFNQEVFGVFIPEGYIADIDSTQRIVIFGDTLSVDNPVGVCWELRKTDKIALFEKHLLDMEDDPLYEVVNTMTTEEYSMIEYYSTDWSSGDTLEGVKVYFQYDNDIVRVKEIAGNKPLDKKGKSFCEIASGLFRDDV